MDNDEIEARVDAATADLAAGRIQLAPGRTLTPPLLSSGRKICRYCKRSGTRGFLAIPSSGEWLYPDGYWICTSAEACRRRATPASGSS